MLTQSVEGRRLLIVRLDSNDDVLVSIREAAKKHGIKHGLVLSGVGSINRYHFHVVDTPELPPVDTFLRGEGPYDILSISGMILDGRVHAHIALANTEKAIGGHLEEGCRILSFGVVVLADLPDADLTAWDSIGQLKPDASPRS